MVAGDSEEKVDIIHVFLESPVRFITMQREQDAVSVCHMYVRFTGKAGLCLLTVDPVGLKVKDLFPFDHPNKKAATQ